MNDGKAWFGIPGETTAVPAGDFQGDSKKVGWLPDESIARKWMRYVTDTSDDEGCEALREFACGPDFAELRRLLGLSIDVA